MATTIQNTDAWDITVYQGKTYVEEFTIQVLTNPNEEYNASTNPYIDLNLTDYDVRMMVRSSFDSASIKLSAINTGVSPRFVKDNLNGIITLTLIPTDTSSIVFTGEQADYVYDIELASTTTNIVLLVCAGQFIIKREVTR